MSKSPRCGAPLNSIADLERLVAEDRAEIVPFRTVGAVAQAVSEQCLAAHGWHVQLLIVERNSDDPVIKVAARRALDEPSASNISVLLHSVRNTPWYPAIQYALAELAIAHADIVFASDK